MQTRKQSMYESFINLLSGYLLSMGSYAILFPVLGIEYRLSDSMWISLWFSILSVSRSYCIRRFFNRKEVR